LSWRIKSSLFNDITKFLLVFKVIDGDINKASTKKTVISKLVESIGTKIRLLFRSVTGPTVYCHEIVFLAFIS